MQFVWSDSLEGVSWRELVGLYEAAPLPGKDEETLRVSFGNSQYVCLVRDADGQLVGAGRALADGADCSYICDIAVLPSYQGSGLGAQLVQQLVNRSRGHKKILLYAVPGKESFYKRFGFRRLRTAMAIFKNHEAAVARGYIDET